ncbi:MAG TPA: hypothetical protein VMT56_02970 [Candidatus Bathyarchaeia archaeon]|nr:hypothetical protein [Candidatus Bathyarchaeia archaeon]
MVEKNQPNPLDELFTDSESQIEPAVIVALLKPFVRINRDTQRLIFTPAGMKLTANNKIILFILAKKVMFIRGINTTETVAPKEVKAELGKSIPSGTIDAALKRLSEKGPIKGLDGRYFIPDFNFPQVEGIFSKLNKE